jgi:putative ABC transport system permease protein
MGALNRYLVTPVPLALSAIAQFPMRAALTAFGILVGVAAVVVTVALGEGTERAVQQKLANMGDNTLSVRPQRVQQASAQRSARAPRITESDGRALAREAPSVRRVAPILSSQSDVTFNGFQVATEIFGTTRDFFDIRLWPLAAGTLWSEQAETTSSRVCLLGEKVKAQLFGDSDPVGRVLRIGRHPFRVLGVLSEKGTGQFGEDQDNVILMPVGTKRSKLQPTAPGQVDQLLMSATDKGSTEAAMRQATAILRERHGLWEDAESDFSIQSQEQFGESQDRIVKVLRLLLTSIAAISLLVGGIGIMNIMLVSVTERTRDIGIRMAIGATRVDILIQFLIEAALLSLIGGALGAAAAVATTFALAHSLNLPLEPSANALGMALAVSTGVGLFFGLVPSWRAASLDPIVALSRG